MNNVIINRGQGGLGRQPIGQDFVSGLVVYGLTPIAAYPAYSSGAIYFYGNPVSYGGNYYTATKNYSKGNTPSPSSIFWQQIFPTLASNASADVITKMGGISDAINAGIVPTAPGYYSDETPAGSDILITTVGAQGDILNVYVQEFFIKVLLCSYTLSAADNSDATGDTLATNLTAAINAARTGYFAIVHPTTANQVDIYARPGMGMYLNGKTTLTVVTASATFASTITQFAGGVASIFTAWWYIINRFFVQSPNSTLYVGFFDETVVDGYLFPEIGTIQTFATGSLRQIGVYSPATYVSQAQNDGYVTALEAQARTLIANNTPASILLGCDWTGVQADAITDLSGLNSEHVSLVLGHDGLNQGASIYYSQGFAVTMLGDVLGLVSSSQVSDDIAWVATYTLSPDGVENSVPALSTTNALILELLSVLSVGLVNSVDSLRYIFGRMFANNSPSGTYVNDSHCCTAYTSDYAYIENNRTFDKAARQLYAAYVAQLAAPLVLNPDGTLTNSTVAFFEGIGEQALGNMAQANPNTGRPELSGFSVNINPAQNVLQTSTLIVAVQLQPVGVAREIIINLSFAVSL